MAQGYSVGPDKTKAMCKAMEHYLGGPGQVKVDSVHRAQDMDYEVRILFVALEPQKYAQFRVSPEEFNNGQHMSGLCDQALEMVQDKMDEEEQQRNPNEK